VLDGGSRDASLAVIRQFERRLVYWRSEPDRGQAAAINEGVACLGKVDYVGWLNAGDRLLPQGLHPVAAYMDPHPGCGGVYGRAYIIDDCGQGTGEFPTRAFKRNALARSSIICQPASLVRRSAWDLVCGVDEALKLCLDYDLWWRLSRLGPIDFLPELVACSR